jgi:hypothetical protein
MNHNQLLNMRNDAQAVCCPTIQQTSLLVIRRWMLCCQSNLPTPIWISDGATIVACLSVLRCVKEAVAVIFCSTWGHLLACASCLKLYRWQQANLCVLQDAFKEWLPKYDTSQRPFAALAANAAAGGA